MEKLPSLLNDKDKLILVVNVCIKNVSRERGLLQINQLKDHFESKFDDTVKVLGMPVLCKEKQGIKILNPIFADNNLLKKIDEDYNKIIKILEENINYNIT